MAQILSEVTYKPKDQLDDLLEEFKKRFPGQHKLDEKLPPDKVKQLLDDLRKEKSGILACSSGVVCRPVSRKAMRNRFMTSASEHPNAFSRNVVHKDMKYNFLSLMLRF